MVEPAVSEARAEILARVRRALADVPADERPEDVVVDRSYRAREPEATIDRFVERVTEYGAVVHVAAADRIGSAVEEACRELGVTSLAVPADLPRAWIPGSVAAVDDAGLDAAELDRIGAALTGCALAIAETGTIVLDGGVCQGRRVLTLVPDVHLCVVGKEQVVDGVPAALRHLAGALRTERRPITFVSGPSATSDIELSRVEGVHGPRHLSLIVTRPS
jgi:L-lactate dehydrogenase complex protein LldG